MHSIYLHYRGPGAHPPVQSSLQSARQSTGDDNLSNFTAMQHSELFLAYAVGILRE